MEKILINSKLGEVEIDKDTIIRFEKGILGFPKYHEYVILDPNPNSPLKLLQCLDNPEIAFVVTNPQIYKPDYELRIFRTDLEEIKLEKTEDMISLVIVTIPRDPSKMTANLKGPLIINSDLCLGKQLVMDCNEYDVKHRLFAENKKVMNQ